MANKKKGVGRSVSGIPNLYDLFPSANPLNNLPNNAPSGSVPTQGGNAAQAAVLAAYLATHPDPFAGLSAAAVGHIGTGNLNPNAFAGMVLQDPGVHSLPRDSELIESKSTTTITYAADPNGMRVETLYDLQSFCTVGNELVNVFDVARLEVRWVKGIKTYPCKIHIFRAIGPNAMTVTDGDYAPASGIKAALNAALANGSVVKDFNIIQIVPMAHGGVVDAEGYVTIDLTESLNEICSFTEKTLNQGGSVPKSELVFVASGNNGATDAVYFNMTYGYHTRKRRIS